MRWKFPSAEVSKSSCITIEETVKKSMQSYLDVLDEELKVQPGYKPMERKPQEIRRLTSKTDPDCGFIHQNKKNGLGI
jgi:hypothetical protein